MRENIALIRRQVVMGKKKEPLPDLIFISPGSFPRGIFPPEKCQSRPEIIRSTPTTINILLMLSIKFDYTVITIFIERLFGILKR